MSSKRKNIINDLITNLKTIKRPRIGKVSEKPSDFARLARTAYPYVQVNVIDEIKEDVAMEWRLSTLTVGITVHIEGKSKTEKSEEQLADPIGMTVTITPVIQGADPITAIVVGGALSGAAAVGVIGTGVIVGSLTYASLATTVGVGLMLSGASQLLTPTPTIPNVPSQVNDLDANANYSFSGIKNVSKAGVSLPLVYGEIFVGSITVSNGVDTVQVQGEA